jgi:hypothetical protein
MAIFRIKPADSVFTDVAGDNAFDDDTAGADTLIVDLGSYLIAASPLFSIGAFLANTAAWTVTINGSVVSQAGAGISLTGGNPAVSTIKIGTDGEVQGGSDGIILASSGNVNNAGQISSSPGTAITILFGGTHTITPARSLAPQPASRTSSVASIRCAIRAKSPVICFSALATTR